MRARGRLGLLLGGVLAGAGCLASEEVCTPVDSTYACCLKQNPGRLESCGASGTSVAVGTVAAAAVLSSDEELFSKPLRNAVETVLRECAIQAHEAVNRRRFGRNPTRKQCDEVLRWDSNGKPITWAMQLGIDKHDEALACAKARLSKMIPGRVSLEQRYRINPDTDRPELVSEEEHRKSMKSDKGEAMKGTLVPDVTIHLKGEPLKTQFIYDFKFPCLESTPPKWNIYPEGSQHQDKTQGQVYEELLSPALRVTPWEIT